MIFQNQVSKGLRRFQYFNKLALDYHKVFFYVGKRAFFFHVTLEYLKKWCEDLYTVKPSISFCIETSHLTCIANDWFLYETQSRPEMGQ